MPASKAQQRAVSKYMKENYDVYQIRMPKGKKDEIKEHAESLGESVNAFINRAIDETIARDNTEKSSAANKPETPSTAPAEQNEQTAPEEEHLVLPWEEPTAKRKANHPKTIEDLIKMQQKNSTQNQAKDKTLKLPWEE